MFSFLFSITESFDPTFLIAMAVSAYTWASGIFSSIPDYTAIDTILAIFTLLHIFVALSYVSVYDAFYKKTMLQMHLKLIKPFHYSPMLIPCLNVLAAVLTADLCRYAWNHDDDSKATLRAVFAVHTWAGSIMLQKLSNTLVKLGVDYAMNVEKDIEKHNIKTYQSPPKWTTLLFAPLDFILRPEVFGAENIPTDSPGLYVMNHALFGMEMGIFLATIYKIKDVLLRGLSDHLHFGQLHGELIRYFGGVDGTRDNVDILMETNQNVLVYPGGGHEIMKPCEIPKYTLMWKQRLGFARMAIKHGYPIIPCCSVGTEDMLDRVFDIDLSFVRKGQKIPFILPTGFLPHRLQKVYFWVGEPIPTAQYDGDYTNDEVAKEVRDKVKAAVEAGIREMQEKQAKDPSRYLINHVGNTIKSMFGGSSSAKDDDSTYEPVPAPKKVD